MIDRLYSKRVSRPLMVYEKVIESLGKENRKLFSIVLDYPKRDDGVTILQLDVDQFSGQPFMLNPNGFICNDIMMFEQCQSDSVARSILQRIKVLHPESLPQNLTLDEMMSSIVPANYGSPSEFVSAHKVIAQKLYKLHADELKVYNQQMENFRDQQIRDAVSQQIRDAVSDDMSNSVPNPE